MGWILPETPLGKVEFDLSFGGHVRFTSVKKKREQFPHIGKETNKKPKKQMVDMAKIIVPP